MTLPVTAPIASVRLEKGDRPALVEEPALNLDQASFDSDSMQMMHALVAYVNHIK